MIALRSRFPLDGLLELANLARSTFYYQVGALQKPDKHADLKATIQRLYHEHEGLWALVVVTFVSSGCEPPIPMIVSYRAGGCEPLKLQLDAC